MIFKLSQKLGIYICSTGFHKHFLIFYSKKDDYKMRDILSYSPNPLKKSALGEPLQTLPFLCFVLVNETGMVFSI